MNKLFCMAICAQFGQKQFQYSLVWNHYKKKKIPAMLFSLAYLIKSKSFQTISAFKYMIDRARDTRERRSDVWGQTPCSFHVPGGGFATWVFMWGSLGRRKVLEGFHLLLSLSVKKEEINYYFFQLFFLFFFFYYWGVINGFRGHSMIRVDDWPLD